MDVPEHMSPARGTSVWGGVGPDGVLGEKARECKSAPGVSRSLKVPCFAKFMLPIWHVVFPEMRKSQPFTSSACCYFEKACAKIQS